MAAPLGGQGQQPLVPQDAALQASPPLPAVARRMKFQEFEKRLKAKPMENSAPDDQMRQAGLELKNSFDNIPNKQIRASLKKDFPETFKFFNYLTKDKLK